MTARPLADRLIVTRLPEPESPTSRIVIPDAAKEKPQRARVLAIGPGLLNDDGARVPLDVKVGDIVLVGKYAGQEIKVDGEEVVILREPEVLAVIEGAPVSIAAIERAMGEGRLVQIGTDGEVAIGDKV